ncbi:hypothetical protein BGW38_005797 [Lunasporangiospora selenospora]|uniref:Uncharacterized protein n=1 Tax=Lunasporangiospora selenospora TaxID=979761 RepID=A0A9P6FMZ0_9FUNG|nr:hypothetical protein BGW38_005797 [Lunasporangiospora selenospora]
MTILQTPVPSWTRFHIENITACIPVLMPKELRNGHTICKYVTIKSHDDDRLYPVKTLAEYLDRVKTFHIMVEHPKDESVKYRPLLRNTGHFNKSIGSQRNSNHLKAITNKLDLPPGIKPPKPRAIGSTAAIQKGATIDDVRVQGYWFASVIFDKHRGTSTNFTTLTLS